VVLSRILQTNFREFPFHALRRIKPRRKAGVWCAGPLLKAVRYLLLLFPPQFATSKVHTTRSSSALAGFARYLHKEKLAQKGATHGTHGLPNFNRLGSSLGG
jgi:hypothetical protein